MNIRKMQVEDYEQVKQIQNEVNNLHIKGNPDNFVETDNPFAYEYFLSLIQDESCHNFVCEDDGKIVGVLLASEKPISSVPFIRKRKIMDLNSICVKEGFQRRGVGKSLLSFLEKVAKKQKFDAIILNVWAFNKSAIKFYESQGMVCTSMKYEKKLKK